MLSVKYYLRHNNRLTINILLALYCLNCSTIDILQLPMFAKKDKIKNSQLETYYVHRIY